MKGMKEEEQLDTEEVIEEEEVATEEVVAEEEIETVAEYDIEEDVNALLGGEDLSEDFKSKAKTIFEAAINTKVAQVKEALEAQYQEQLVTVWSKQKKNSRKELILTLSMLQMSGLTKTNSPSSKVLRPK